MYIEDEYTELKIELTKDIKKEIIAFANTKGGKIYIGIDDGGNVVGLNNAKGDLESLSGMIREGIKSDLTLYTSVNLLNIDDKDGKVDLKKLVMKLGEMGIDSILLEGGGTLNFSALNEGIVDKVQFYVAPKIIGGINAKTAVEGYGIKKLSKSFNVSFNEILKVGRDILIEGYIEKEN